jgi:hypothetical protein
MAIRFKFLVTTLTLCVLIRGTVHGQSNDTSAIQTTVPMSLEGNYKASSLVLHYYEKKIDQRVDKWKPEAKSDVAAKKLIDGITLNDAKVAYPILEGNPKLNSIGQVEQFIETYNRAFKMQNATIVSRIELNGRDMFIWEVENSGEIGWSKDRWIRRAFTIIETNGKSICDYAGTYPIETFLLDDVLQQVRNHPDLIGSLPDHKLKYMVPLSHGANPLIFEFDGVSCNLNIADDANITTNMAARFYMESYSLLTNATLDSINQFYKRLTPITRERMRVAVSKWPNERLHILGDDALARKIIFVLDAHPIYIVFFKKYNAIHHEYLIQDGVGNLFLTSLYNESFLDDVLNSSEITNFVDSPK